MRRTPAARRRQRSVRVAFAATVLLLSTAGAAAGIVLADPLALSVALVVSVVCGWAALRVVVVELRQQRRAHAADRARLSQGFHAEIAEQSTHRRAALAGAAIEAQRTAGAERAAAELEATLRLSEARAHHAEHRARAEGARADSAVRRVHDLEVSLAIRSAEEADELASWDAGRDSWELDTVVDLLSWSAGPGARATDEPAERRAL
jgi:hypothetical protein